MLLLYFISMFVLFCLYFIIRYFSNNKNNLTPIFIILSIFLTFGGFIVGATSPKSVEYWTGFCESVEMREGYWHLVTRTHRDSKGRTTTYTVPEYVYPRYSLEDSNGLFFSISGPEYKDLANKITSGRFQKNADAGRTFTYHWDGSVDRATIITSKHLYDNRTQNGQSLYKYKELTKEEKEKVYERPNISFYDGSFVVGGNNYPPLSLLNARIGKFHQVVILLVLYKNEPIETSFLQESYWKGGEKNELVCCYSLDDNNKVQWGRCFSWTKREDLKEDIGGLFKNNEEFSYEKFVFSLSQLVPEKWERRQFAEFSYISNDFKPWVFYLFVILEIILIICLQIIERKTNA